MQRFIDKVPMLVDHLLVLKLKEAIPRALESKLPFGKPNQKDLCADLLRQADDIIAKRKELNGRRTRLEEAREELNRVWLA
jgi:Dynamin GTPase effector domain